VLARFGGRVALFQDGEWQFLSGKDAEGEFHKHEAKIPALLVDNNEPEVLIIGGGDGLAARDILRVKPKAKITLVDIDGEMIKFAATNPIMRKLNKDSLKNAGFHFTSCGGIEMVKAKIESWGHQEFNNNLVLKNLEKNIRTGQDIFMRDDGTNLKKVDLNDRSIFDERLSNIMSKYSELISEESIVEKTPSLIERVFQKIHITLHKIKYKLKQEK
jgi:hypothetical protein